MGDAFMDMWVKVAMGGFQFQNPLATMYVDVLDGNDREYFQTPLRAKYKNYDLPENFTDEELLELDEWLKQYEL